MPFKFRYYVYVDREEIPEQVKFINPSLTDDEAGRAAERIQRGEVELDFWLNDDGTVTLDGAVWNG